MSSDCPEASEPLTAEVENDGPKVFISYRREDCLIHSSALMDGLTQRLPGWAIFRDLDSLVPGTAWHDHIQREIEMCAVVLVMIGDDWLDVSENDTRRLDDPGDILRQEIEAALNREVPMVPLLVEGTRMPAAAQLPKSLQGLARLHAMELTEQRWSRDIDELAENVRRIAAAQAAPSVSTAESEWIPKRVTESWLRKNAAALSEADLEELVRVLRNRGWPDGWIIDYAFFYANPEHAPLPRRASGDAGQARNFVAQKRITESYLARVVPDLDGDSLAALTAIMKRRGWSDGQIEDCALAFAREDAVEPQTF